MKPGQRQVRRSRAGPSPAQPGRERVAGHPRPKAPRQPSRPRRQPPGVPGRLLILECDADRLAAQGVTLGHDVAQAAALVPGATCHLVGSRTKDQLLAALACAERDAGGFGAVVIVGHSNVDGLRMASDLFADWRAVGRWLEPFRPRRLILVACEAGRWLPSKALFDTLPSLQQIYGAPVPASERESRYVVPLVPYLLLGGRLKPDQRRLLQVLNFVVTRGLVFCQTRQQFRRSGIEEGVAWTMFEEIIKQARPSFRAARM